MGCFLLAFIVFNSCKKEYSCEDFLPSANTSAPNANAGADQTIVLPADTVKLDGSASTDADNDIMGYEWTKTSVPAYYLNFFKTHINKKSTCLLIRMNSFHSIPCTHPLYFIACSA